MGRRSRPSVLCSGGAGKYCRLGEEHGRGEDLWVVLCSPGCPDCRRETEGSGPLGIAGCWGNFPSWSGTALGSVFVTWIVTRSLPMFTGLRSRQTEEWGEVESQKAPHSALKPPRGRRPCALYWRLGFAATFIGALLAYCECSASASCNWPWHLPWNVLISPLLNHWLLGRMRAGLAQ